MGEPEEPAEVDNESYYKLLNSSKEESCDQIRKNFRRIAMKAHPDKGGDPAVFAEMSAAAEVLTDADKRKVYDRHGVEGINKGMGSEPEGQDIFDLLNGRRGGGNSGPQVKKCDDAAFQLKVSLDEVYNGKTTKIAIQRDRNCVDCGGKGGSKVQVCGECKGKGIVIKMQRMGPMVMQSQGYCDDCGGKGEIINPKFICVTCRGNKVIKERKVIEIQVDKGVPNNHKYTFMGEADEAPGYQPGDLIVGVQEKPHDVFKRKKADLVMTKNISLLEALSGFKFTLKHLDGTDHLIQSSQGEVVKPGDMKTVEDMGMPIMQTPYKHGNLFIYFEVEFPLTVNLTPAQDTGLKEILPAGNDMQVDESSVEKQNLHSVIKFDKSQITENKTSIHTDYASDDDEDPRLGGRTVQCQQQLF